MYDNLLFIYLFVGYEWISGLGEHSATTYTGVCLLKVPCLLGDHVWVLGLLHLKNMFSNHMQGWQPHTFHVHFFHPGFWNLLLSP